MERFNTFITKNDEESSFVRRSDNEEFYRHNARQNKSVYLSAQQCDQSPFYDWPRMNSMEKRNIVLVKPSKTKI
jgi:hypothetical protein